MDPLEKFKQWHTEYIKNTTTKLPYACCLASIGSDGYPNSRFVSLKEIKEHKFVITGSLTSRKGLELLANPKASLTFWWPETQQQIRIQGDTSQIDHTLANTYFKGRHKEAQIVSHICQQGIEIDNITDLTSLFEKKKIEYKNADVPKPNDWSGFYIDPKRIEFMEFKSNRFHYRELYTKEQNGWSKVILQP
ncbi:pyridoxal 5'-phosphate synthase [uncultured Psychroserpens sp.]|uniref:pyridoxine/pyridoxamine 5'-phosphate oxidase n=1 Tax=uncultured Psychroserpens sp. TaxID=255436 RepID=UPI002629B1BF|nr:pyridoxal 5'-phosphate synthase [uncultured Psychroserpens sp.]